MTNFSFTTSYVKDTKPAAAQIAPPKGIYVFRIDRHNLTPAKTEEKEDRITFILRLERVIEIAENQQEVLETDTTEKLEGADVIVGWSASNADKFRRDFGDPLLSSETAIDSTWPEYFNMLETLYSTEQDENWIILTVTRSIYDSGMQFTNINETVATTKADLDDLLREISNAAA